MKVIWSPRAYERVVEIGDYVVAQGRPAAASNLVRSLLASARRLREFPASGRMLPERPREDLREVIHGAYRVIYRVDPDQVVILTVRHSRIPISPEDPELE